MIHGWEDQSVVENLIKNGMLSSKSINLVLRNRQLTLGPPCPFAFIGTSSAGAK
jgi:hypothetical protein